MSILPVPGWVVLASMRWLLQLGEHYCIIQLLRFSEEQQHAGKVIKKVITVSIKDHSASHLHFASLKSIRFCKCLQIACNWCGASVVSIAGRRHSCHSSNRAKPPPVHIDQLCPCFAQWPALHRCPVSICSIHQPNHSVLFLFHGQCCRIRRFACCEVLPIRLSISQVFARRQTQHLPKTGFYQRFPADRSCFLPGVWMPLHCSPYHVGIVVNRDRCCRGNHNDRQMFIIDYHPLIARIKIASVAPIRSWLAALSTGVWLAGFAASDEGSTDLQNCLPGVQYLLRLSCANVLQRRNMKSVADCGFRFAGLSV